MAVFIDFLGIYILILLLPQIMEKMDVLPIIAVSLISINAVFSFIFGPILGRLSDKYGRKPLLMISQFGTMLGFLIFAFAPSNAILGIAILFISRIVDGIFGGNFPIAKSVISDATTHEDRAVKMANIGLCVTFAALIGPMMGGLLANLSALLSGVEWMLPGLVAAGLSLVTVVITAFILPETWPKEKRSIIEVFKENKSLPEHQSESILKNKTALYLLTQWGFHSLSFFMYTTNVAIFAALAIGIMNPFEMGIYLSIAGIFQLIYRFTIFKPILRKLGEVNTLRIGLGIMAATFFMLFFVNHSITFIIFLIFVSFGASLSRGPMASVLTKTVSPRDQGKINGFSSALDSLAQIFGPLFGGFVLSIFLPIPGLLGIFAGLLAMIPFLMILNYTLYRKLNKQIRTEGEKKSLETEQEETAR